MTAPSGGCVRVGKATSSTQRTFDPRCDTFDVRVRSTQIPADFGQEPLESAYTLLAQRDCFVVAGPLADQRPPADPSPPTTSPTR